MKVKLVAVDKIEAKNFAKIHQCTFKITFYDYLKRAGSKMVIHTIWTYRRWIPSMRGASG